jgi:hypothetical protein
MMVHCEEYSELLWKYQQFEKLPVPILGSDSV